MKFKSLKKKAQESRNDMLIWYVACFVIVIFIVGVLHGFGIIGDISGHGSFIGGGEGITAATILIPEEDFNASINDTSNTSPQNISHSEEIK